MADAWMANDQIAENTTTLTWLQNSQTPAKGSSPRADSKCVTGTLAALVSMG